MSYQVDISEIHSLHFHDKAERKTFHYDLESCVGYGGAAKDGTGRHADWNGSLHMNSLIFPISGIAALRAYSRELLPFTRTHFLSNCEWRLVSVAPGEKILLKPSVFLPTVAEGSVWLC